MSTMGVFATIVVFLSIISAFLLYRTLKFGKFMHAVPYIFIVIGVAIGKMAPDNGARQWRLYTVRSSNDSHHASGTCDGHL